MRKIIIILLSLNLITTLFAEDAGGLGNGGDISGLGDNSTLNNINNNSSLGNNNAPANITLPSANTVNGLNLNNPMSNEQFRTTGSQGMIDDNMYKSTQGADLYKNAQGDDMYKNANGTGGGDLWQNYANINMRNGGMGVMGGQQLYVPSVLGSGYVMNPLNSQDSFQKNVQIRSGLFLPIFGYTLFLYPQTFAPVMNIPVDANYLIGTGDQLNLKVWGSVNMDYSTAVANDGTVFIPKVGKIMVIGIRAASINDTLKIKMGQIYRNFSLSATLTQVRPISVNVAGYAIRPGTYQLSPFSSISNAVFAVGGPSMVGSLRDIQIKRNGLIVANFDMYDILLNGDNSKDLRLQAGDVIYFPPRISQVAIYDGIKVPAIYEARITDTVADIVKFAGGFNYNTVNNKIVVEQLNDQQEIIVKNYTNIQGMNKLIANGEIIHFFSLNNSYNNSVVLMGNVAMPTRLAYKSGMKISDLIPNKDALLTRSFWNSYSYNIAGRDNLLTQIGKEKTTIQVNADNTAMYSTGLNNNSNNNANRVFGVSDNLFIAGPIQIPEANINWNYATIIRLNKNTYSSNVIPFNLRKALNGDPENNLNLQAGDIVDILSAKDVRTPSSTSTLYVFIDGEVNAPGVYEMTPGDTIQDVIKKASGISPKAYLFGTELNREIVKKKQQAILNQMLDQLQQNLLGQISNSTTKATNGSQVEVENQVLKQQQAFINNMRQIKPSGRVVLGVPSSDVDVTHLPAITIENGDTIYIPSRPSTVDVVGQVYNPATFMYKTHTTVKDYIEMAGTENEFADSSNEYVLQADGTLYSRQQSGWFGSFGSRNLNPGDAVIVPQQIQFGSMVQNILNWTQILSNFGVAAAAISVFKN